MSTFRLVVVALVLTFVAGNAEAQVSGNVEQENVVRGGENTAWLNAYAHGPLAGKFGWSVFTQSSSGWGQTYAGLTFAPAKWLEVSGSLGLETDPSPTRVGASVWIGRGKFSLLSLQEDGGSGRWQKNVGVFQVTKVVAVGALQQSFVGAGPYMAVSLGKVTVWGSYTLDDNVALLGTKFNF